MKHDPEIAWTCDVLEAVLWADQLQDGFVVGVAFDEVPFVSERHAKDFFIQQNLDVTILKVNGLTTYMTYLTVDEDSLVEEAEKFASRLLWRV